VASPKSSHHFSHIVMPKVAQCIMVMGNPSLGCEPDLDVAMQYVAEPMTINKPEIQSETMKPFTQNLP
jgi:hypothetical protein